MLLSPFTPLFFLEGHKCDGRASDYIQTFSTTDRIFIELFGDGTKQPVIRVYKEPCGELFFDVQPSEWRVNDSIVLTFATLCFNPGTFSVEIEGIGKSEPFRVTDDKRILADTTLIQYSMRDNRQRNDVIFFIDGMQYFFDFRVPGGFKDEGWTFGVESEQFVTQYSDIAQLYGLESTQKTFTLGGSQGVPVWFGELLNRILVCSHVYFDGVKYTRKDTSVPELNVQLEGVNSFVFSQLLQRSVNLDPVLEAANHIRLRRVGEKALRITNPNMYRKI